MTPGNALVTGAGARLGQAMAVALAEAGWSVAIHYRSSATGAEDTATSVRAAGRKAALVKADLSNEEETAGLVAAATEALGGPITLLVNSASTFVNDSAASHTRKDWDFHMGPNLRAPIVLAQHMAKGLTDTQQALVINLIDQRVWALTPDFFTYTLSKAALWQATQTLAQSLAPNVRVNGIGPGPTLRNVFQSEADFANEAKETLTRKGSSPAEIVKAMHYLIDADSVTGQMIASDGGQHLMWHGA